MARGDDGRSVRVFTVATESRYLVVRNVPALGVVDELLQRLGLYGKVCEHRVLDHPDDRRAALKYVPRVQQQQLGDARQSDGDDDEQRFTEVVWVQYETVNNARHAKAHAARKPFFGSRLLLAYAPQFESRADTASKLAKRRHLLQRRAHSASHGARSRLSFGALAPGDNARLSSSGLSGADRVPVDEGFIGPQLPWRAQQRTPVSVARAAYDPPVAPSPPTEAKAAQTAAPKAKRRRI